MAFVATTACRVIFERTKKTSRIGPDTPDISASAEQITPHADECHLRSTLRCRPSGSSSAMKGVDPITSSDTGLLTTSCSVAKMTSETIAPPA